MARQAVLIIQTDILLRLAQGGYQVIGETLPRGIRLVNTTLNSNGTEIRLVLEHPSFGEIQAGHVLPFLPSPRLVKAFE